MTDHIPEAAKNVETDVEQTPLPPEAKPGELWVWNERERCWEFTGTRFRKRSAKTEDGKWMSRK